MGLREDIMTETIEQLPLRRAVTIAPEASLANAIGLMRESQLGCVFVVDEHDRPLGKFTEREVLRLICDCAPLDGPVENHIVPITDAGCVKMTDPISRLVKGMQETRLRFVCVVDGKGRVVALTGQKGLMEYITERFPRLIKSQEMDSKLHMNKREGA